MSLQATTSQTVGPYFSIGLTGLNNNDIAGSGVEGERVTFERGIPAMCTELAQ